MRDVKVLLTPNVNNLPLLMTLLTNNPRLVYFSGFDKKEKIRRVKNVSKHNVNVPNT